MARRRQQSNPDQLGLLEARVSTAPLVPGIREKVTAWREGGYKGVSDTTGLLLNYWFYTDHRLPNSRKFAYHYFQREAVETLIYLYEAAKVRRHKSLVETFATRSDLRLLQYDDFARSCVKMATGSGKTKVMSLAIAWQFFNAVVEARDDFARGRGGSAVRSRAFGDQPSRRKGTLGVGTVCGKGSRVGFPISLPQQ
jgi:hypothetical protein